MQKSEKIALLIASTEKKLTELDKQRAVLQEKLFELKRQKEFPARQNRTDIPQLFQASKVTNHSSEKEKITLFRSLFAGRKDVFARRFESAKTGIRGYYTSHKTLQKESIYC